MRNVIITMAVTLLCYSGYSVMRKASYARHADVSLYELMRPVLPSRPDARDAVVFVFAGADCQGYSRTLARLDEWQARGVTTVVAARVGSSPITATEAEIFSSVAKHIQVKSISPVSAALIADALGYSSTPFGVVVDVAGRIAGAFPGNVVIPESALIRAQGGRGSMGG